MQQIYNHFLTIRYFPHHPNTTLLKFIPKNNSEATNPMNFRPISLLETTGKNLEKFLNNRVRNLLEEKQFYHNSQHGFRRKRGTDTALTIIHETIAHHLAEKRQCYLVQRDNSKAFDKVWQKGI